MAFRSTIDESLPEKVTAKISAKIVDESGVGIPSASLTTLTLTLYDVSSEAIINARNNIDIKNLNGGTVDTSGNMTYTLTPLDNAILVVTNSEEKHIMLIKWTYNAGAKAGIHEIELTVKNLNQVT